MGRRLLRLLAYLASFGLARGGLFAAPLLLANMLSAADYGRLEFAQAVGSLTATVLALGTASAVPLALIQRAERVEWSALLLHQSVVAALLALAAGLGVLLAGAQGAVLLPALCAMALLMQGFWSTCLKSTGRPEASLLLDTGLWLSLAAAAGLAWGLGVPAGQRAGWAVGALAAYAAALLLWTGLKAAAARPAATGARLRSTLATSAPLMLATLLALLVTTSGRLGVGLLSTPEITGVYATLARAAALPIVAHQVIMVARFRHVFSLPEAQLGRALLTVVGWVALCVVLFGLLGDRLGWLLGPAFEQRFAAHRLAGLMVLSQCVLWSAIALNDLVNTRMGTADRVARVSLAYLALSLPLAGAVLMLMSFSLERYVALHSAVMLGYYLCQSGAMDRAGVRLRPVWLSATAAFLVLTGLSHVY